MWLRMVNHYPKSSIDALPNNTGRSWYEWVNVLNNDPECRCGISPLIEYLMTAYNLDPVCAQTIALEYVLGQPHLDA